MDFADLLQDLIAALATVLNGIPQGLLALSYGFASVPTGLGFLVGAAACGLTGSVAPVSFQAETIVLAGQVGKDRSERVSMIIFAAILTALLGLTGVMSWLVEFSGTTILNAMMAGVGFMLARVALDCMKTNRWVTLVSIGSALAVYFFVTQDLVWVVTISMLVSTVFSHIVKQENKTEVTPEKAGKLTFIKPKFNMYILRGALALSCMTIGGNIAYGSVTANIAQGATLKINELTIYSGLADVASSLFGGMSLEAIISATATAPHPVLSAILMQVIMGAILLFGVLPKIGKYVPTESIAGFLFILGAFIVFPMNASSAFADGEQGARIISAVTMIITAIYDPFSGICSGVLLRSLFGLIGF